jgi:hypothetical protein
MVFFIQGARPALCASLRRMVCWAKRSTSHFEKTKPWSAGSQETPLCLWSSRRAAEAAVRSWAAHSARNAACRNRCGSGGEERIRAVGANERLGDLGLGLSYGDLHYGCCMGGGRSSLRVVEVVGWEREIDEGTASLVTEGQRTGIGIGDASRRICPLPRPGRDCWAGLKRCGHCRE